MEESGVMNYSLGPTSESLDRALSIDFLICPEEQASKCENQVVS
jgi:hypothetical protein